METFYNDDMRESISIAPSAADYLREAAKWGKFLAIVGFVVIGLMVVMALFAGAFMGAMMDGMSGATGGAGAIGSGFLVVLYLLFALLYFFPVLYLYRFSSKAQQGVNLESPQAIAEAFKNLKSLLKFMGILTIIMIAFYGLALLFMVLGMGIGSMM
ncbi:hypothetical protein [Pontibacter rugosus]|uniref:DUF5362 domain-containing protein n=1 Tax=Pontibacter rugosus TaxID=1745966 RepID=A0ABW3SNX7_9BACT